MIWTKSDQCSGSEPWLDVALAKRSDTSKNDVHQATNRCKSKSQLQLAQLYVSDAAHGSSYCSTMILCIIWLHCSLVSEAGEAAPNLKNQETLKGMLALLQLAGSSMIFSD